MSLSVCIHGLLLEFYSFYGIDVFKRDLRRIGGARRDVRGRVRNFRFSRTIFRSQSVRIKIKSFIRSRDQSLAGPSLSWLIRRTYDLSLLQYAEMSRSKHTWTIYLSIERHLVPNEKLEPDSTST